MRIYTKNFFVFVLLSMMLLTPTINISGPLVLKSLDVYITILFIIYFFLFSVKKGLPQNLVFIVFSIIITLIYLQFIEAIYQFGDKTGLFPISRMIATILAAYGCSMLLISYYKQNALKIFFNIVILCAIIQGVVIWLSFLDIQFRELMSIIFYRDMSVNRQHLVMLRVPGFVPTGGDGLSMNQAFLCVVGLLGVYLFHNKNRFRPLLVGSLFIAMLSAMFTGRSGLYLGVVFFVFLIFLHSGDKYRIHRLWFVLIALTFIGLGFFFMKDYLGNIGLALLADNGYEHPLVRLLKGFIKYKQAGSYEDNTIRALLTDHVIIPDSPFRFFFGNGDFGRMSDLPIKTDIGYFRMWHGMGLLSMVFFLGTSYVYPVLKSLSYSKKIRIRTSVIVQRNYYYNIRYLFIIMLIYGFIAHYKIFFLTTRIYCFVFFVVIFIFYREYRAVSNLGVN